MSSPGISGARLRATRLSWRRSEVRASAEPGYCTFTATSRPSTQVPRCTCPIEAAAAGSGSNQTRWSFQSAPSSRVRISRTVMVGIGGAESCSRVRCSRYGAAISSGSAASKIDIAWPNFIAPPLRSPRVRNSCSAVRCWTSVSTDSAEAPPMRLPKPSAVRPAYPRGRAASLAVRAAALRGSSLTRHPHATPGHGCGHAPMVPDNRVMRGARNSHTAGAWTSPPPLGGAGSASSRRVRDQRRRPAPVEVRDHVADRPGHRDGGEQGVGDVGRAVGSGPRAVART